LLKPVEIAVLDQTLVEALRKRTAETVPSVTPGPSQEIGKT
jgi:hypothetical protein